LCCASKTGAHDERHRDINRVLVGLHSRIQFEAAQAAAGKAEVLQAGTIQTAYVLTATTDAEATRAGYLHEANSKTQVGADHIAGVEAAKAQAANAQVTATATEEIMSAGNTPHHHYHHGLQALPMKWLRLLSWRNSPLPK
jgi:hypothetical protein